MGSEMCIRDRPCVAAIRGGALGGGFELALGCDFIIASDTARIGLVEVSVGLMPLSGGVQRLVNRVGLARAKEITMFGRRYDAKTLETWGAINMVVPDIKLLDSAISFSKQLANGPTTSFKEIKKIANITACLLYTSPSPRDLSTSRMPSSA